MIYGYLRVSTDEQDINSQKQGVDGFAAKKAWTIDEYITDEGVSGGKDPKKRHLGALLDKIKKDDVIIASEISRLGRDLYMVMDILHFCMQKECVIYTVKDRFVLGGDIQSKVLAFAFGLSAEIERQMIQQRTREGLRLRVKQGILLGRPPSGDYTPSIPERVLQDKDFILKGVEAGMTFVQLSRYYGVHKDTMRKWCYEWGSKMTKHDKAKYLKNKENAKRTRYKDNEWSYVELPWDYVKTLIEENKTIPEIHALLPQYTYEQVYDSIYLNSAINRLYRQHAQKLIKKK